jgi:hypothetical protein
MHSFARLDRSSFDLTSCTLDRDVPVVLRYLPAPLRRFAARRTPHYGVLWLIIDR